jgi:serine-threonine kinase receptor-associated protein
MIRNGDTGDWIGTFQGHKGAVWCARLNAAATQAVTGSADYSAKYWDALSGEILFTFNHGKIVKAADFLPGDKTVITGGVEREIRSWDLNTLADAPFTRWAGHTDTIKALLPAPDGAPFSFLSCAADSTIRVWDVRSGQVKSIATGGPVTSIDLTPDLKYLIATFGKTVNIYDGTTFEVVKSLKYGYDVHSAALSPDKATLVAGGTDFWVHVYNFESGAELEVLKGHHGPVHCVKWPPTGLSYASGS